MNNQINNEDITLRLPINSAYVSTARLTASSIANRMNFDIEEIEDIKVAVSESCVFFINKLPQDTKSEFTIVFLNLENKLEIHVTTNQTLKSNDYEMDMGLMMVKASMDEFQVHNSSDGYFTITMVKEHKIIIL